MIRHYLKVAFRNLWKYRAQSIISIAGLAVGFTCFSLATLWIRYEMTYDHFHRNAGQMYVLSKPDNINPNEYQRINPYPLAGYLKKTFPEIINACNIIKNKWPVKVDNAEVILTGARIDSAFLDMFDIKIIEGSPDFTISGSAKVAVTEEKGRELFGDESALGKTISVSGAERTICAIVSGYSKHSNYPFEMLEAYRVEDNWNASYYETLIELAPGTDAERFAEKLHEHTIKGGGITIKGIKMTPLTSLRYEDPIGTSNIKFHHIVLFCLSGALVILCSLFNYLT
ncbi:MAG: ABC transporter permease, partial [Dysgonamonadaceae bacterium]|nr:ABC transporter permease [Dysgonamonadaceae bacterium]